MYRTTLIFVGLLAICAAPAFGQIVVTSRPVVTHYAPAPHIVSGSPVIAAPVVYAAPVTVSQPVTTYYAPAVTAAPVTSYYAPASGYVVPTTSYYAPVTTYYGGTIITPAYGRPVTVGRSLYGTLTPYVPGQPVRNALRFSLP